MRAMAMDNQLVQNITKQFSDAFIWVNNGKGSQRTIKCARLCQVLLLRNAQLHNTKTGFCVMCLMTVSSERILVWMKPGNILSDKVEVLNLTSVRQGSINQ